MTGVWRCVFVVNLILNYFMLVNSELLGRIAQLLMYFVLVTGIIFTIWYPGHLMKNNPRLKCKPSIINRKLDPAGCYLT